MLRIRTWAPNSTTQTRGYSSTTDRRSKVSTQHLPHAKVAKSCQSLTPASSARLSLITRCPWAQNKAIRPPMIIMSTSGSIGPFQAHPSQLRVSNVCTMLAYRSCTRRSIPKAEGAMDWRLSYLKQLAVAFSDFIRNPKTCKHLVQHVFDQLNLVTDLQAWKLGRDGQQVMMMGGTPQSNPPQAKHKERAQSNKLPSHHRGWPAVASGACSKPWHSVSVCVFARSSWVCVFRAVLHFPEQVSYTVTPGYNRPL